MKAVLLDNDPPPVSPEPPEPNECCQSGCDPCIFDFYAQELEAYRAALRAWEERRLNKQDEGNRPAG